MRSILMVAVVATASACVTTGHPSRGGHNLITRAEVASTDLADAYTVVRALRPRWLRKVGPSSINAVRPIMVYIDGNRMDSPDALHSVPKIAIEEIRYYRPTEAQARWGLNHTHGAIAVATRRGEVSDSGRLELH